MVLKIFQKLLVVNFNCHPVDSCGFPIGFDHMEKKFGEYWSE